MTAEQIEAEALKLSPKERERLAEKLYLRLDDPGDRDYSADWATEALRRNTEMDADPSIGIPAEEAFRKAYDGSD